MDGGGKYGAIVVLDADARPKLYPKGMPMFVLLGKDACAPAAVEAYADALEREAGSDDLIPHRREQAVLRAQAVDVRAFAMRMRAWQIENPDAVKRPD